MLTVEQAADRLGIKVPSLYAYVSRGLVERHTAADGRSMFEEAAIIRLASRGRPRLSSRESSIHLLIETELTRIDSQRVSFRGHDVAELVGEHTFEQVAELLWLGRLGDEHEPWVSTPVDIAAIPGDPPRPVPPADRLRIALALAGAADPFRSNLEPEAVAAAGRHAVATMVDALGDPPRGPTPRLTIGGSARRSTIAARLWIALAGRRRVAGGVEVLNSAMVLLADHELAASTLGARVAASARADPYAVIGAGLGVVNGALHGRASSLSRRLLDDAAVRGAGRGDQRGPAHVAGASRLRSPALPGRRSASTAAARPHAGEAGQPPRAGRCRIPDRAPSTYAPGRHRTSTSSSPC